MKITILGGGGTRTPLMVEALRRHQEQLGLTELALMDNDGEHLELMGDLLAPVEKDPVAAFKIIRTTDAHAALEEADFVITTFRVGGMEGRVIDEKVPLQHGILGQETTGPGGFAMAMRSIPVLLDYLSIMRQACPNAWLINFANPAGILAETISRVGKWPRAAGICDSPGTFQRAAAALLGASPEEVYLDYFGLNHLGWVRSVIYQERDYLPEFIEQIIRQGGVPGLPFPADLIAALRMIPNEYLYYYYFAKGAVENILRSTRTRGEQLVEMNRKLFADLGRLKSEYQFQAMKCRYEAYLQERSETYMNVETGHQDRKTLVSQEVSRGMNEGGYTGVAIGLMEALTGHSPKTMVLNIPNRGGITGMDVEDVVEISGYVGPGFIRPMAVGEIPAACLGLMKQVKEYERLTIEAATEGSYAKALQALTIHPLIRDGNVARRILNDYRLRHGVLFPNLA